MNQVTIIGNLGQDPELRYTQSGTAVVSMSVATNRTWKDSDDELQRDTNWHDVTVFGKQGENCEKYLSSGSQVAVIGRIQYDSWEDDDGNKRYSTDIVAQNVEFLSDNPQSKGQKGGQKDGDQESFDDDDIPF